MFNSNVVEICRSKEQNREKLAVPSRGGSRLIANHKFTRETIVKMKEDECAKLVSTGTTISLEMEYEIVKNVVITIILNSEIIKSALKDDEEWKSKHAALEEEQHINKEKLRSYEEKVKQSEKKSVKLFQFVISKFLEAQDMLFLNHDMDEPLEEE
ncbi:hypothetical protein LXL04_011106 [Taraxacum kok-saghyz]